MSPSFPLLNPFTPTSAEDADMPPTHQLGDGPIQREYKDQMVAIMRTLDEFMNGEARGQARKVGIVVLMFPFNQAASPDTDRCNFISNGADRHDLVALFKEMIGRFEGQSETSGSG